LKEERRIGVFENRALRTIFGPKRGEVIGEERKLHNKELNYLYCSPNNIGGIKSRRTTCYMDRKEKRRIQDFGGET
jgi:hypothetical protein